MTKMSFQLGKFRWLAMGLIVFGMGITMPSCPGQQAMQQQIDQLQTTVTELNRRVGVLETQLKASSSDQAQAKGMLEQMAQATQGQKAQMDQMSQQLQALDTKITQLAQQRAAPKRAAPRSRSLPARKKGR